MIHETPSIPPREPQTQSEGIFYRSARFAAAKQGSYSVMESHLNHLRRRVTAFSILVETMLEKTVRALVTRNRDLPHRVVEVYEPRANAFENEIEEYCMQTIARLSPKARDLRFILMALKMNTDLERMADLSEGVARSVLFLIERPHLEFHNEIPHMAFTSVNMIRNSTRAFLESDTELARQVCRMDDLVDSLHDRLVNRLRVSMQKDGQQVNRGLELIGIANRIERISDHATNIAEDVIYIEEGRNIRHSGDSY